MNRRFACLVIGLIAGCGRSAPDAQLPSWFRSDTASSVAMATSEQIEQQIAVVEAKLKSFEQSRSSVESLLDECAGQKTDLVARMKRAGIESNDDLKAKPRNRQMAEQLLAIAREIESYQQDADRFGAAISHAQALHRRLQRALVFNEAGISEAELAGMTAQMLRLESLDDRPAPAVTDSIKLDELLRSEVYGK